MFSGSWDLRLCRGGPGGQDVARIEKGHWGDRQVCFSFLSSLSLPSVHTLTRYRLRLQLHDYHGSVRLFSFFLLSAFSPSPVSIPTLLVSMHRA
jgi:hypothetical protein